MNLIKKSFRKLIFVGFVFLFPLVSLAQSGSGGVGTGGDGTGGIGTGGITPIKNPIGVSDIGGFINVLLTGALKIGIPVIALAIIYSGFLFVFAQGNEEKLKTAKDTLLYTLIGAAILLGAFAIASMVGSTIDALK